ncbi:MAG: hypothetical protein AMJ81_03165 [Phycisphaerae bacterium SM23_33]|nr:MAG: hypothetical protein AMJ81_03165 [Phycisphaerae bacterium SM23_33]
MWDDWKKIVVLLLPFFLVIVAAIAWLVLKRTIRSRFRMERQLRDDPDINEWLVVFGWSRKVLYGPTILMCLVAAALMLARETRAIPNLNAGIVGGIWLAVFFVNFLVDEYEMSVKVLLIALLLLLVLFLWLLFLGWVVPFVRAFRHLAVSVNSTGYLVIAALFLVATFVSWLRGLFYYVALTPNYLNIQTGPTETGEQVSREEYSTRIDTGDFLERLFGFGRIIITFSDQRRQPVVLLVGRIGRKAAKLESIRGKLAVDRYQAARENG